MQQASPHYLRGAMFGLAGVSIWAGWSAITRLAVITNLDAWDIPALRFGVAGLLLVPIVIRRGLALDRLGWSGLAGLIVGTGAPYALVVALGLRFAPGRVADSIRLAGHRSDIGRCVPGERGPLPAIRHPSSSLPRVAITPGTRNPFAFHRCRSSQ
jgi:hypothetical protein